MIEVIHINNIYIIRKLKTGNNCTKHHNSVLQYKLHRFISLMLQYVYNF